MDRRTFLHCVVQLLAALAGTSAGAQQAGKVWRIGTLVAGSGSINTDAMADFRRSLDELGYVDGRNIRIVGRSAEGVAPAVARRVILSDTRARSEGPPKGRGKATAAREP